MRIIAGRYKKANLNQTIDKSKNAFSHTLEGLIPQIEKPEKEALQWIVGNARGYSHC